MNIEPSLSKATKKVPHEDLNLDDFDFKPITSGLGFHHSKIQEVKPVFTDKTIQIPIVKNLPAATTHSRNETPIYENDLSLFYKNAVSTNEPTQPKMISQDHSEKTAVETSYELASKFNRFIAYALDLFFVLSVLLIVLVTMTRTIDMDLVSLWENYPHEITPLVCVLFCGFYMIYFSIFEKSATSTIGKNMLGLGVLNADNSNPSLGMLVGRSFISLLNFLSFGLFSWFDLQGKITQTKIIRKN